MADDAIETAPAAVPPPPAPPHHPRAGFELRRRVLGGSAILLLSSVLVGLLNLVYNLSVAHQLGAAKFGHASVVYTLLMLLSSVTLSFQLLCSKFVARSQSHAEGIAIYRLLHRRAWLGGLGIGLLLAGASPVITRYLNLPSPVLIRVLAIGSVVYVPLGARRGYLQGTYDFLPLALNFVLEGTIKLIGAMVLISSGYGVEGVIGAISASVLVAYFTAIPLKRHAPEAAPARLVAGMGEGVQALTFFIGQVIINNLDIILVKHFFDATQAGVYAAIALVGRVVYMLGWSVVSSMFPFSAGIRSEEEATDRRTVLTTALALVAGISAAFILGVWLAPRELWRMLLGSGFPVEGHGFYSSLLALYALTTGIYALGVVLMSYEISRKIGNVGWLQLSFSGAIVVGIYLFHQRLESVIAVQLVLMMVLLLMVSLPFLRRVQVPGVHPMGGTKLFIRGIRTVRPVDENEVIAEFLRGEFYQDEFRQYRERFAALVSHPDLQSEQENALRRALLFRRRGRLWRELPVDTRWWEVELGPEEILRTRVFPRNQWLRYGAPGFLLTDTVGRLRSRIVSGANDPLAEKLRSLGTDIETSDKRSAVILITLDETSPLTIIEGNHRMTAAGLASLQPLNRYFRVFCGFSPHMAECCWYQTDISTLWRYAKNTLVYYLRDRRKSAAEIFEDGSGAGQDKRSGANLA